MRNINNVTINVFFVAVVVVLYKQLWGTANVLVISSVVRLLVTLAKVPLLLWALGHW